MGQGVTGMTVNHTSRARRVRLTLRRVGTLLLIALSGLGVLVSLVGIIAVWRIRGTLTEGGTTNLARVEVALGVASTSLQTVNTGLDAINADQLTTVGRSLASLPELIVSLNATLEAANKIPFISVPTLDPSQIERIGDRLETLSSTIEAARQRRATASGSTGIDDDLQAIRAASADLNNQILLAQVRVAAAKGNWAGWIDRAAIALTLLLGWLTLAQAGLGRLAWENWRLAER